MALARDDIGGPFVEFTVEGVEMKSLELSQLDICVSWVFLLMPGDSVSIHPPLPSVPNNLDSSLIPLVALSK